MSNVATPCSISRSELYELIWSEPMTRVAPRFGLSDVGLAKVCKRYDIPRPPVGYWAQREFGKEPRRTPLPPAEDESQQLIEFTMVKSEKPPPAVVARDRVADKELKTLIEFEKQPENRIAVNENPPKYHPIVRETKAAFSQRYSNQQGLDAPGWTTGGARLDIQVDRESVPRALQLMDALIKAFEQRGHKVIAETKDHRQQVMFVMLGEKFSLRLREKTRMIRIPESERKNDFLAPRVKYEPTGSFELQLQRKSGMTGDTFKDAKRAKLEEQLNAVMIELVVAVEQERQWRRQQEESERQRREEQIRRWQQEQERRKEEQRIEKLKQIVQNWDDAARIRAFIADVRFTVEQRGERIEEQSELARWMAWAMNYADAIDPLTPHRTSQSADPTSDDGFRPSQPR